MRAYPTQSLLCPLLIHSPLIRESQSGLIKILNEKLAGIGYLFLTYFMTYFFICVLLENCMLGFDTLCVTHAEMFPDKCMPKPFSRWAVRYHVRSGYLLFTAQDSPTQGGQVVRFLSKPAGQSCEDDSPSTGPGRTRSTNLTRSCTNRQLSSNPAVPAQQPWFGQLEAPKG